MGHGERSVAVGTLDMAILDAVAKIGGAPIDEDRARNEALLRAGDHRGSTFLRHQGFRRAALDGAPGRKRAAGPGRPASASVLSPDRHFYVIHPDARGAAPCRRDHHRRGTDLPPEISDRALDEFVGFALELADAAHAMLAPAGRVRPDTTVKPDRSFVTSFDLEIERRLRALIGARFPAHGVIGEEHDATDAQAELVWVLDPIDGTAPFIAGAPVYGTLIALALGGRPIVGVIAQAATADRWVGARGRPTRHTDGICRTRACPSLGQAILTSSNPDFFAADETPALDALRARTAWRIYGTACMAYGLLASGRTDVALDTGFKVHDFAPYVPIVEGAGGIITDWEGRPLTLDSGPRILATGDPERHAEALAAVRTAMAGTGGA